jgi:hypothetical protein
MSSEKAAADLVAAIDDLKRCESRWFSRCDGFKASVRAAERIEERIKEDERRAAEWWPDFFKQTATGVAVMGIAGLSGFAYRWAVASGVGAGVASGFVRRFYSKPKGSDPNSRV